MKADTVKAQDEGRTALRALGIDLRAAAAATLAIAVLLCGVYPLVVWAIGQGLFPNQADGSLVRRGGIVVGSELIAQSLESAKYFHPRPSAAGEAGYDATASSGSNLGPLSKTLVNAARERAEAYRAENGLAPDAIVPADAVTTSGSGLDPHISVRNAHLQAPRVARERGLDEGSVMKVLDEHVEGRDLGILGEPRVNVLKLNLALDRL